MSETACSVSLLTLIVTTTSHVGVLPVVVDGYDVVEAHRRADGMMGEQSDLAARRHWHTHCWKIGA